MTRRLNIGASFIIPLSPGWLALPIAIPTMPSASGKQKE
jgi:hypothetical protein